MTEELKTLKDLIGYDILIFGEKAKAYSEHELRYEIIRWIKILDDDDEYYKALNVDIWDRDGLAELRGAKQILKKIFNISEEDLE